MNSSEIHSSLFNQSTYSDIRGVKHMETEGTYLLIDFSQTNHTDKIHQDNFSRANYADIKVPFMRRHSTTDRDPRMVSTYADLDFSKMNRMECNDTNYRISLHTVTQPTVYSKIRTYSSKELDQEEYNMHPRLYAKVVPKSQRKKEEILKSKSTHDISSNNIVPVIHKPELKPISVPFKIKQISNFDNIPQKNRTDTYDIVPEKVIVPNRKTPIRHPPPIRPKPLSGHNQAPPLPPHSPSNSLNIPNNRIGHHSDERKLSCESIHNSNECLSSLEIISSTPYFQRNYSGRSQSFRGPPRVPRPDKPPPPPPAKPTFQAFHPNNPIMMPKSSKISTKTLNVSIPNLRTRSQGDKLFGVAKKEPMTPPLPVRQNPKLPILNNFKKTTINPSQVTMETDRNSLEHIIQPPNPIGGAKDMHTNKLTAVSSFNKKHMRFTRPDLPPKPKPRNKPELENIVCQGKLWKRNPKTNELSTWFAVLNLFTLKLYQSKEDQPWLTIPTIKIREINTFLLVSIMYESADIMYYPLPYVNMYTQYIFGD
ncbi:hypothetical protein LOD99_3033 [Oopsacas minuta]|uniref:Uncharacterized protein n=1 Tax=Oopsacas minuta TaxID=111878 RepID=A0AAV7K0D3_9METZ|nr:hypothetical protein LOD99_3033 [Oopsacas minuta]